MNQIDIEIIYKDLNNISEDMDNLHGLAKTIQDAISHCADECKDSDHVLPVIKVLNNEINNTIEKIDELSDVVFKIKYL